MPADRRIRFKLRHSGLGRSGAEPACRRARYRQADEAFPGRAHAGRRSRAQRSYFDGPDPGAGAVRLEGDRRCRSRTQRGLGRHAGARRAYRPGADLRGAVRLLQARGRAGRRRCRQLRPARHGVPDQSMRLEILSGPYHGPDHGRGRRRVGQGHRRSRSHHRARDRHHQPGATKSAAAIRRNGRRIPKRRRTTACPTLQRAPCSTAASTTTATRRKSCTIRASSPSCARSPSRRIPLLPRSPSMSPPTRLTATLDDGRRMIRLVDSMPGFPGQPMSRADVERKFRSNIGKRWPQRQTETVLQALWALDRTTDFSDLLSQLA